MSGHAEAAASLRQILAEVENTTGCGEWPQRHPDDGDAYCAGCEIATLAQKAMMDLEDLTAAAYALVTEVDWDDLHSMARMIDALRVALGAVEPRRGLRGIEGMPRGEPDDYRPVPGDDDHPAQWEDEYLTDNGGDELGRGPTW